MMVRVLVRYAYAKGPRSPVEAGRGGPYVG